jgi:hypothetical protein
MSGLSAMRLKSERDDFMATAAQPAEILAPVAPRAHGQLRER